MNGTYAGLTVLGRLTKQRLNYTSSGIAVNNFTLVVDVEPLSDGTNKCRTEFFDCVAWKGKAEYLNNFHTLGDKILITGKVKTESYVDEAAGGVRKYRKVTVVEMLEGVTFSHRNQQQQPVEEGYPDEQEQPAPRPQGQRQQPQQTQQAPRQQGPQGVQGRPQQQQQRTPQGQPQRQAQPPRRQAPHQDQDGQSHSVQGGDPNDAPF